MNDRQLVECRDVANNASVSTPTRSSHGSRPRHGQESACETGPLLRSLVTNVLADGAGVGQICPGPPVPPSAPFRGNGGRWRARESIPRGPLILRFNQHPCGRDSA